MEPADYTLSESEAPIYLACEDGASVAQVCQTLPAATQTEVSADDVRAFLDELVGSRLIYHEEGRYLALALPASLPEEASS